MIDMSGDAYKENIKLSKNSKNEDVKRMKRRWVENLEMQILYTMA